MTGVTCAQLVKSCKNSSWCVFDLLLLSWVSQRKVDPSSRFWFWLKSSELENESCLRNIMKSLCAVVTKIFHIFLHYTLKLFRLCLHTNLCVFTSGAPVTASPTTFSCSAWRSWSRVCSLWCCGWPTPSNCCTSSSMKSLSCCSVLRRTKVDRKHIMAFIMSVSPAVFVCFLNVCLCVLAGLLDPEMSSTRTACEEAMTVLEEVIMFTFQQSVYYLTKVGWFIYSTHSTHKHSYRCFTSFWPVKSECRSHVKQEIGLCKHQILFSLNIFQTENTITEWNTNSPSGKACEIASAVSFPPTGI